MDPLTMALILGGTGLLKSELVDRPKEDRQRKLSSATQRYSPWTGLKADPVQEADPFGSAMQGGVQGFAMGQNMQNHQASQDLMKSQSDYFKSRTSPNSGMMGISSAEDPVGYYSQKNPWRF